ncbi:MAG: hypothetical protein JSW27_20605 [Phycisphaerales bacterium]|nr:MAG: hypothetical protein JSW27_20605 [Phycisphaerales bacterium]
MMSGRTRHFRRADLSVALLCATVSAACFGAIDMAGRERAKRAVCLSNLKQLTLAWARYADDHDGNLVNGDTGEYTDLFDHGTPWVLRDWRSSMTVEEKELAIHQGALFPYTGYLRLYRCPLGDSGQTRSYAIVDSMNCKDWLGSTLIRNRSEIEHPAERFVFIDAGGPQILLTGGWSCYPDGTERWWDRPPIQHNDGTTLSFADGHVEYWQWEDPRTVEFGRQVGAFSAPQPGNQDIRNTQLGVWGQITQEPTASAERR